MRQVSPCPEHLDGEAAAFVLGRYKVGDLVKAPLIGLLAGMASGDQTHRDHLSVDPDRDRPGPRPVDEVHPAVGAEHVQLVKIGRRQEPSGDGRERVRFGCRKVHIRGEQAGRHALWRLLRLSPMPDTFDNRYED